jgi:hypothetical protein
MSVVVDASAALKWVLAGAHRNADHTYLAHDKIMRAGLDLTGFNAVVSRAVF